MNDVRVMSLMGNSVLIQDLAMDVAHGQTVVVPGDKAAKSKDLWRLISQKQLFRLNSGPFQDFPPVARQPGADADNERLREENRRLIEKNRLQEEQNQMLRQTVETQGSKLDAILAHLAADRIAAAPSSGTSVSPKTNGVVDAGVPTYMPSVIKPEGVESHVEVQSETSDGEGIAGAASALRKLRRSR